MRRGGVMSFAAPMPTQASEDYGARFDVPLRHSVAGWRRKLNPPVYWAAPRGQPAAVMISYPRVTYPGGH